MLKLLLFLRKLLMRWWALMSCAAFTFISFWSLYQGKSSGWQIRAFELLALLFLVSTFYCEWKVQYDRAELLERQLKEMQDQKPKVTSRDWEDLSTQLRLRCGSLRADYQRVEDRTTWRLAGGHTDACGAWLRKAGTMLINSPTIRASLSSDIISENDATTRWLMFLETLGAAEAGMYGWEELPEGKKRYHFMGSIKNLSEVSANVCVRLSAEER